MRTIFNLFIRFKSLWVFMIILFFGLTGLNAQTPQYYNYQVIEGTNYFPFGVTGGKGVQWLFTPGNFNQPAPSPSGYITKIYFYMGFTNGSSTLYNLTIILGQTTLTDLPAGVIYTGQRDTVYFKQSVNLISHIGQWMSITLDNPYLYDTSLSLIVEVSQCGATNNTLVVCQHTYTGLKRCYMSYVPPNNFIFSGQDDKAVNCGFDITPVGGINKKDYENPKSFSLSQNYPNPFNPSTTIEFALPKTSYVKLIIYDMLGREVETLVNEELKAGSYKVSFDGSKLSSGVYYYKLITDYFTDTKKMILVR